MKVSNKRGFTLIEVLVVVLIIGILAAVALPQYQLAVAKSRAIRLFPLMRSWNNAQQVYYLAHGTYANDYTQLDIDLPHESRKGAGWLFYNDFKCLVNDSIKLSFQCTDLKSNITVEKYNNSQHLLCWAGKNNSFGNKVCKSLPRASPGSTQSTSNNLYQLPL